MRISDRVSGAFVTLLGGLTAYGGAQLPPIPGQQIGPAVFPMVIGSALILCGVLIALGVGARFELEAEADLAAVEPEPAHEPPRGFAAFWRVALPPALLLLYVLMVERIGFIPTAALLVFVTSIALGAKLRLALPVAVVTPFVAHLLFAKLLRVPLAPGLLPVPW